MQRQCMCWVSVVTSSIIEQWSPSLAAVVFYIRHRVWIHGHRGCFHGHRACNPDLLLCAPGRIVPAQLEVASCTSVIGCDQKYKGRQLPSIHYISLMYSLKVPYTRLNTDYSCQINLRLLLYILSRYLKYVIVFYDSILGLFLWSCDTQLHLLLSTDPI